MDVETALQGAHDLQEALLGDVEVAHAGEAAGGAIGGAGVVAGTSGVQVVSADIHVPPAQHVSEKGKDKHSDSDSSRGHSSTIDDSVHFSFLGGLCFGFLLIAIEPKEVKLRKI